MRSIRILIGVAIQAGLLCSCGVSDSKSDGTASFTQVAQERGSIRISYRYFKVLNNNYRYALLFTSSALGSPVVSLSQVQLIRRDINSTNDLVFESGPLTEIELIKLKNEFGTMVDEAAVRQNLSQTTFVRIMEPQIAAGEYDLNFTFEDSQGHSLSVRDSLRLIIPVFFQSTPV